MFLVVDFAALVTMTPAFVVKYDTCVSSLHSFIIIISNVFDNEMWSVGGCYLMLFHSRNNFECQDVSVWSMWSMQSFREIWIEGCKLVSIMFRYKTEVL